MKLLVLGGYDSSNYCLLNIIQELHNRNIEYRIVCTLPHEDQTRMFTYRGFKFTLFNKESITEISQYDIVLAGNSVPEIFVDQIRQHNTNARIFVIAHHCRLSWGPYLCSYADVQFVFGRRIRDLVIRQCFRAEVIAAGSVQHLPSTVPNKKKIVFIEDHMLPVGMKGRQQLAEWLVKVAHQFPDYKIEIKPRRISRDIKFGLNQNRYPKQLYIHELIKKQDGYSDLHNIIIHDDYIELEELCHDAECIIMAYVSTGAYNAFKNNKGLLFLDGFDFEEHQDLYHDMDMLLKQYELSGCRVNYQDAMQYLPHGISVNQNFAKYEVESLDSIGFLINFLEFYNTHIIQPKIFLPYLALDPINYENQIFQYLRELNAMNINQRNKNNFIFCELEKLYIHLQVIIANAYRNYFHNFYDVDWLYSLNDELRFEIENQRKKLTKSNLQIDTPQLIIKEVENIKGSLTLKLKSEISEKIVETGKQHKDIVVKSKMLRFYFMHEAYQQQCYIDIIELVKSVGYNEPEVAYYAGKTHYFLSQYNAARKAFELYLKSINESLYFYTPIFSRLYLTDALFLLGDIFLNQNNIKLAKNFFERVIHINGGNHNESRQRLERIEQESMREEKRK